MWFENIEEASVFFFLATFLEQFWENDLDFYGSCFQSLNFWYWIFTHYCKWKYWRIPRSFLFLPRFLEHRRSRLLGDHLSYLDRNPFSVGWKKDKVWIKKIEERWKCQGEISKLCKEDSSFRDEICHNWNV